jgi:hypothetical protein
MVINLISRRVSNFTSYQMSSEFVDCAVETEAKFADV